MDNWSVNMGYDRYDVIIVGAGPAGSAAAYLCAENNLSVALMERGELPGSKNMFGGSVYSEMTSLIISDFWESAPLERIVTTELLWFMEPTSAVQVGFTGFDFAKPPYNTFTAIRSRFDRWFAEQAVKKGAHLMNSTLVEDLIYEKIGLTNKKVGGVILDDGTKIYSNIVILAEGAMADLTKKAGMRRKITTDMVTVYVKELLSLPREIIEARFNLDKDEGANIGMIGYPTSGAIGKGGIWTNKDTISLIVGGHLDQLIKKGLSPYQLITRLKKHPKVKRLINGAETVSYMAHIIPKGGYKSIPQLYDNGILIVGDAGMMISGRHGLDNAMLSGKYAAETVIQAKAKGDFDRNSLSTYHKKIMNAFFMKNIEDGKNERKYYIKYPDADFLLSQILNDISYEFFNEAPITNKEKLNQMNKEVKKIQSIYKTLSDLYHGF